MPVGTGLWKGEYWFLGKSSGPRERSEERRGAFEGFGDNFTWDRDISRMIHRALQ